MSVYPVRHEPLLLGQQTRIIAEQQARTRLDPSIFYCNGMTTTLEAAQQAADKVAQIAQQEVHLHFNDTTPLSRVVVGGTAVALGVGCIAYAAAAEKKTDQQKASAFIFFLLGLGLSADALMDYSRIQDEKRLSAEALAGKVERFLARHPQRMATLVLHSQGAHIGYMALERLRPLRGRINVISIGSMIKIPDSFGRRVENLRHTSDLVSQGAHAIFDATLHKTRINGPGPHPGQRTITHISQTLTDCTVCHGAEDYMSNRYFEATLLEFTRPA